jgi:hypothetical protein
MLEKVLINAIRVVHGVQICFVTGWARLARLDGDGGEGTKRRGRRGSLRRERWGGARTEKRGKEGRRDEKRVKGRT